MNMSKPGSGLRLGASAGVPLLLPVFLTWACGASSPTVIGGDTSRVAAVSVTPAVATIQVDDTVRLAATATEDGGAVVNASVAWTHLDPATARVDGGGLVTGVAPGAARIVATTAGVADTATVTVTTTPPRTVFFREGFDDAALSGRGWYDNTSLTISTTERYSGAGALEVHFNQSATVPTFGGAARHLFDESETVYVSFWLKYASNWQGSGRPYHPHDIQIITNEDGIYVGPRDTHLTTYIESTFTTGILPKLAMQDRLNIDTNNINVDLTSVTESRAAGGCNGNRDAYATGCYSLGGGAWANEKIWPGSGPLISANEWHFAEIYFQLNSIVGGIGQPDGRAQYWIDGQVALNLQGVLFRTGAHPTMRFNQFVVAPYIGDGSPVSQTMWIDELTVADVR